jgi:multidrug efflux pump subunit AcrA (membrane-fusion protein)
MISQLIDPRSRGFTAEAKVPADPALKPNLLATVKINDYSASNVIVIPLTTLQTDEKGKYVFVMVEENGKKVARKKPVVAGEVYGEQIEIKDGLVAGDQLISQGFQSIYDGQVVATEAAK